MKRIYLDYASTTPVDKTVQKIIKKFSNIEYANPSALYASAIKSKNIINDAREKIASILHAHSDEIIFTSGGTESNNIAIQGITGGHIIISSIEHSSILETAKKLEERGVKVTYLPVDNNGLIDLDLLKKSITKETVLVSIMTVNNEIGSIQPIQDIAKVIRDYRKEFDTKYPIFHTDACQAPLYLPLFVEKMNIDILTLDSTKLYGPKGIGLLYIKRGVELKSIIFGGSQEKGIRPGTENVPAIMGFCTALEIAEKIREKEFIRISYLKNYFVKEILKINPNIKINGDLSKSIPHILNISIPNIDNEFFVLQSDARGVECSTKSACLKDEDESYVLRAIGSNSKNSVRFSFGKFTDKSQIKKTISIIKSILKK